MSTRGRGSLLAIALTAALVGPASGGTPEWAVVTWAPDQVSFVAPTAGALLLTVTGPGFQWRGRAEGAISFRPLARDGSLLPDGRYRFELREIATVATGPSAVRSRPRTVRSQFRIESGAIVAPEAELEVEAGAGGEDR